MTHAGPDPDCVNCDGHGCMGCVFREWGHECAHDCPHCCAPHVHDWQPSDFGDGWDECFGCRGLRMIRKRPAALDLTAPERRWDSAWRDRGNWR